MSTYTYINGYRVHIKSGKLYTGLCGSRSKSQSFKDPCGGCVQFTTTQWDEICDFTSEHGDAINIIRV